LFIEAQAIKLHNTKTPREIFIMLFFIFRKPFQVDQSFTTFCGLFQKIEKN